MAESAVTAAGTSSGASTSTPSQSKVGRDLYEDLDFFFACCFSAIGEIEKRSDKIKSGKRSSIHIAVNNYFQIYQALKKKDLGVKAITDEFHFFLVKHRNSILEIMDNHDFLLRDVRIEYKPSKVKKSTRKAPA